MRGRGSGISRLSTNNVPPTVSMVREPSLANTGATRRLTTKPIGRSLTRMRVVLCALACLSLATRVVAIDTDVDADDFKRAVEIATGRKAANAAFHTPYVVDVSHPVLERVEVVTEFRRFVMASEAEAAVGRWGVARGGYDIKGRTLKDLLRKWQGQTSIRLRARFHPLHAYPFLPIFQVLVGDPSYLAIDVQREAIMSSATPPRMTGATVEAWFNAQSFENRHLPVRIVMDGQELTRFSVDFAALE